MAAVVVPAAASMDLTAAAMSQWADFMSDSRRAVNDFDASLTMLIVASNISGAGDSATVIGNQWSDVDMLILHLGALDV